MGTRGPLPGDQQARVRPGKRKTTRIERTSHKYPPLPNAESYSETTREWYETWATSEQASKFNSVDWFRLRMLAPLVERYFKEPTAALMAEVRQNETRLGATAADRARLGWEIEDKAKHSASEREAPRDRRPDPRVLYTEEERKRGNGGI